MKRLYYKFVIGLQGVIILSSIINIIYCAFTKEQEVFAFSMYLPVLPIIRFNLTKNIIEIVIMIVFLAVTLLLYYFSTKQLLDDKNIKAPFTAANFVWYMLAQISLVIQVFNDNALANIIGNKHLLLPIVSSIVVLLMLIMLLMKWSQQNNNIRKHPTLRKDNYLPENFQLDATGYNQITRTAKGSPVILCIIFLLCTLICYLQVEYSDFSLLIYGIGSVIFICIFFSTIIECKKYERKTKEKPPHKNYLKKLCIMQITAFVLYAISFVLIYFLSHESLENLVLL